MPETRSVLVRSPALVNAIAALVVALVGWCAPVAPERPQALVAPDRSAHLLDRPFPSDELRVSGGGVALPGFARPPSFLGGLFVDGWVRQAGAVARGFSATTPIFFRFESAPALASRYEGSIFDPVLVLALDSLETVPVNVRWVEESNGDPYLPDRTLVVTPAEERPLRSGERYLALVSSRVARPAPGWTPPAEAAGFDPAVATVFTVQDVAGELRALRAAADALIDADPALLVPEVGLREVVSLRYAPGTTPSGRSATAETVTFADGGTEVTYLERTAFPAQEVDLRGGPMAVYQATIRTAAFQDPAGKPWQSSGLGIVGDTGRSDGWIAFAKGGTLLATPRPEPMRIVVQVPRERAGPLAIVDWGHGSGGDAYESIARTDPGNDLGPIRAALAARGALVVGGDLPLFGRRFDFVDRGYDNNLLVVNIPNLPAFRASVQQGAVDQHVRLRFAREVLPGLLGAGSVDASRAAAFGHSIGAQMAGVAVGAYEPGGGPGAVLLNGTGGFVTHSVLASDLLQLEGTVGEAIFALAGLVPDPDATPAEVLGALFGVPEAAWPNIDRHHPLALPFQLVVEGGDPLAVARAHAIPLEVFAGDGDRFVPADGFAWLAAASGGLLTPCAPRSDYDGHFCVFREPEGVAAFARLVDGL